MCSIAVNVDVFRCPLCCLCSALANRQLGNHKSSLFSALAPMSNCIRMESRSFENHRLDGEIVRRNRRISWRIFGRLYYKMRCEKSICSSIRMARSKSHGTKIEYFEIRERWNRKKSESALPMIFVVVTFSPLAEVDEFRTRFLELL